jgi:hypothetical protein
METARTATSRIFIALSASIPARVHEASQLGPDQGNLESTKRDIALK